MKKIALLIPIAISLVFIAFMSVQTDPATAFLSSLKENQKAKTQYDYNSQDRFRWHYLPATMFARPGIALLELDAKQKQLVFDLLKSNLSTSGYDKTRKIIDLENVLAVTDKDTNRRDPEKGCYLH